MPAQPALDPRDLGQRIASLRHANGWSQRRLAEAAGVSHGYIALLELGRLPSPGKFRLDAVARALNLRTSDALTAPDPPMVSPDETIGQAVRRASLSAVAVDSATAPERRAAHDSSVAAAERSAAREAADTLDDRQRPPSQLSDSPSPPAESAAPPGWHASATHTAPFSTIGNVRGRIEQLRAVGAQPLPIFRWGACGDPRDQESGPDPDRLEFPPPGRESLIGSTGFGVVVKGDSMAGRGIYDGDLVWVNPDRPYAVGKVVLALVTDVDGETAGMVVKTYARTEVGDCLLSETSTGRSPVVCREFKVIGPVVGITSWRLPN
jgi:SOS-response transcriptional repressor LexA